MRGSPTSDQSTFLVRGIIPAHAGLTTDFYEGNAICGDHPRACGAHRMDTGERELRKGSSPRMRGSLHKYVDSHNFRGIIPAHAGLTCTNAKEANVPWDHPRACGAHLCEAIKTHFALDHPRACGAHTARLICRRVLPGSSPRMRGSQEQHRGHAGQDGIIPAHAGLTLKNPNIDAILSGPHPVFYSVLRVIR